jgi:hypothetical protein
MLRGGMGSVWLADELLFFETLIVCVLFPVTQTARTLY